MLYKDLKNQLAKAYSEKAHFDIFVSINRSLKETPFDVSKEDKELWLMRKDYEVVKG